MKNVALAMLLLSPCYLFSQEKPSKEVPSLSTTDSASVKNIWLSMTEKLQVKCKLTQTFRGMPLRTFQELMDQFHGLKLVTREDLFHNDVTPGFEGAGEILDRQFRLNVGLKDLTLEKVLSVALPDVGASYLVRDDYIEIVPFSAIRNLYEKEDLPAKASDLPLVLMTNPIVNFSGEGTLAQLAEKLGKQYDQTIVCDNSWDQMPTTAKISFKNVPFSTAMQLLAKKFSGRLERKTAGYFFE